MDLVALKSQDLKNLITKSHEYIKSERQAVTMSIEIIRLHLRQAFTLYG